MKHEREKIIKLINGFIYDYDNKYISRRELPEAILVALESAGYIAEVAPAQEPTDYSKSNYKRIQSMKGKSMEPVKPDRLEKILEIQIELHEKLASYFRAGSKIPDCYNDASRAYRDALSKIQSLKQTDGGG